MAQSKVYDLNSGQWPKYDGFEPLTPNSKEIRLLLLQRNVGDEDLRYSMRPHEMHSVSYCALSYSWGAPVPNTALKSIIIDGGLVLIRPTLYWFLRELSTHRPKTYLWIDAICINQSDVEERNQQISMMGEIYKTSSAVFVWLGVGDDETNYALEHISNANPQTPFDDLQFSSCTEKLFKSSYWTRRWVIQEFALATELSIVCGQYMIPWRKLTSRIDAKVLEDDISTAQIFENFQGLQGLRTTQGLSLLQLMQKFRNARCVDRRDKAFALRAIAEDGESLSPDYRESVGDVYFRILSQLPTEQVLPEMIGYRFPHQAASTLRTCMAITKDDLLDSLVDKSSDRMFAEFEIEGSVESIEGKSTENNAVFSILPGSISTGYVRISHHARPKSSRPFTSCSKTLKSDDLVCRLQSSVHSWKAFLIAFSSDPASSVIAGTLHLSEDVSDMQTVLANIERIVHKGVRRCTRNATARPISRRILCHVSRSALVLLWLMKMGERRGLDDTLQWLADHVAREPPECRCSDGSLVSHTQTTDHAHLEILPALLPIEDGSWLDLVGLPWITPPPLSSTDVLQPRSERNGRTDFSYAVEEGHLSWVQRILRTRPNVVDQPDNNGRTPLSWAMANGQEDVIKFLITSNKVDHNKEDSNGEPPLRWAIKSHYKRGIELLLAAGKVTPNNTGRSGRTPLSWAARDGDPEIVKALLASNKVDPDARDVDGVTPLLWAAKCGHETVVELLLATNQVDYNRRNLDGQTAMSLAAAKGFVGMVKALLAQPNIGPDVMDNTRATPLRWAAKGRHKEIFDLLTATGKVREVIKYSDYETDNRR